MAKDRTSFALTAIRAVSTLAKTTLGKVDLQRDRTHVPAYVDDAGVYVPAVTVEERDPEADAMMADLNQVIDILSKWDRTNRLPKSVADRLAWMKNQES
jgi:hypothetical protein